ncbi:MAG: hypothetical protein KDE55_12455 [Novosphingobium sp.]|nr:hypothetical protein [Novosphingobium sp.]
MTHLQDTERADQQMVSTPKPRSACQCNGGTTTPPANPDRYKQEMRRTGKPAAG